MKTLNCKQGSTEWAQARLGVVTASEADVLLTPTGKISEGKGVETYLYKKLSEKILGYSLDTGGSFEMGQGQIVETIARPWFSFTYEVDVATPGLCLTDDGKCGCSPDGMLPDGSGLEIKSPQGPTQLRNFFGNKVPAEHMPQIIFSMMVTGAPYWTFVSFHKQLPPLVLKVERDEKQIAAMRSATDAFLAMFAEKYAVIKRIKDAEDAAMSAAYAAQTDEKKRA